LRYIAIQFYSKQIIVVWSDCKIFAVERVKVTLTSKYHSDSFVLIKQLLSSNTHYSLFAIVSVVQYTAAFVFLTLYREL